MVKAWDYIEEYKSEKEEILSAIQEVLASGSLILGEKVKKFEEQYALYCGVKYGVGVDNGTNAIFLALKALGIGYGDEVITVSNTAIATVSAIVSAGATPVFTDIEEKSFLIDVTKIENAITPKTKCILPVHLFGQCADMDEINRIAKKHKLKVIEDCAQSHGAVYKGQNAGSMSDIAATSFYPTKILGAFGDAGMVLTNSKELYQKVIRLRTYGMSKTNYSEEHGYNCRLDELHAAILLKKLLYIEEYINKRRALAGRYYELLKDTSLKLPHEMPYGKHSYYLYVVRHPQRNLILEELKKKEIFLNIHYPYPVHTMKGYKYLGFHIGDFPLTEQAADEIFSLPMYPSLTFDNQAYLADIIHEILIKHNL